MNEEIRQHLARLHAELANPGELGPADRELARRLATDLNALLAEPDSRPAHYQSLRERLRDTLKRFEATHPRLATAMEQAIDQLAQLNL